MITFFILGPYDLDSVFPSFGCYYFKRPFSSRAWINYEAYMILPPCPVYEIIPTCFAILEAVILLSPVTIITLIPAFLQLAIASFDYSLGGSSIPKTPNNVNPFF